MPGRSSGGPRISARRRAWGQHFLVDRKARERILRHFCPRPEDVVLEIGPGRGALTSLLLPRVRSLIAVEIDPRLAAELEREHGGAEGFRLIEGDILRQDIRSLAAGCDLPDRGRLRVIGNLPYSIATVIVRQLLDHGASVSDVMVMTQREVANRLVASPGTKDYGFISVMVALRSSARMVMHLPPGAFRPPPRVHSSVVALELPSRPPIPDAEVERLDRFLKTAFSQRRKTLLNALRGAATSPASRGGDAVEKIAGAMESLGLDPGSRAEQLPPRVLLELMRRSEMPPR